MAVVVGADGQLINTSNIGGVGAGLVPNLAPNIGALANVSGSTLPDPMTNEDGTITLPTFELKSRGSGLELGELQNLYGTKYMPMFQFIEKQQTGTYTYDPADDNLMSQDQMDAIKAEFEAEHGMSADMALLQAKAERAGQKTLGATAAQVAGKAAQAMIGDAPFGEGALIGLNTLNPFKGMMSKAPTQALYGVKGGTKQFANVQDAKAYKTLFPDSTITDLPAAEAPKDFLASGLQKMQGKEGTTIVDRLYGSEAAGVNFKVTAAAAGADFITQVAMGADPMDAAKDAGKTAVLSYVANAIIPGSGPIVGFLSKFF
jgi:hypothetical protein